MSANLGTYFPNFSFLGSESSALSNKATMTCSLHTVRVKEGIVEITFQFEDDEPIWLRALIRKFAHLMNLKPNWDSYGANPIEEKYVRFALTELLPSIMEDETYLPAIVPTAKGSIQLEWHMCSIDLEVRVISDGKVFISYEDLETGEEIEGEIEGDFERLKNLINPRLSNYQSTEAV
jgi:hypothetical protein